MGVGRWPNVIFKEGMSEKKNMDETKLHMDAKMKYLPQCLSHK